MDACHGPYRYCSSYVVLLSNRIDGSAMEYEENVSWTRTMATIAHGAGAAVEAELGKLAGEEDGLSVPEVEAKMTDPQQVSLSLCWGEGAGDHRNGRALAQSRCEMTVTCNVSSLPPCCSVFHVVGANTASFGFRANRLSRRT